VLQSGEVEQQIIAIILKNPVHHHQRKGTIQ